MHLSPKSWTGRAQAIACALAVTVGLTVAPALISTADASSGHQAATSSCASAQSAAKKAKHNQAVAKKNVAKAKKALAKAKRTHKKAKVAKAKKALAKANKRYQAATRSVKNRQSQARSACASSNPPAPSNSGATDLGKKLSLLGLGDGLSLGAIDASQLTALLNQLLPGVTDHLSGDQLTALLAGFNGGSDLDPTEVLSLLSGVVSPDAIAGLLGGSASPEVLTGLITDIISQLSGLGGDLPIPSGAFDPTGLWQTFAGILGNLDPSQLGSLLSMLTSAFGSGSSAFNISQLTDLIDALVPGISDQFDPSQLISMLGALNGGGLSADTLANLLGGQFSVAQIQSVLDGTAGQALLGSVISQVVAQLGTAGAGGLSLPGTLDPTQLTNLLSTVTNLFTSLLGGTGVLPVVCGLIPIPGLCP